MNSELETDYKNLQESIAQTKKAFEDLFKELGKITAPEEPQGKKAFCFRTWILQQDKEWLENSSYSNLKPMTEGDLFDLERKARDTFSESKKRYFNRANHRECLRVSDVSFGSVHGILYDYLEDNLVVMYMDGEFDLVNDEEDLITMEMKEKIDRHNALSDSFEASYRDAMKSHDS